MYYRELRELILNERRKYATWTLLILTPSNIQNAVKNTLNSLSEHYI